MKNWSNSCFRMFSCFLANFATVPQPTVPPKWLHTFNISGLQAKKQENKAWEGRQKLLESLIIKGRRLVQCCWWWCSTRTFLYLCRKLECSTVKTNESYVIGLRFINAQIFNFNPYPIFSICPLYLILTTPLRPIVFVYSENVNNKTV